MPSKIFYDLPTTREINPQIIDSVQFHQPQDEEDRFVHSLRPPSK